MRRGTLVTPTLQNTLLSGLRQVFPLLAILLSTMSFLRNVYSLFSIFLFTVAIAGWVVVHLNSRQEQQDKLPGSIQVEKATSHKIDIFIKLYTNNECFLEYLSPISVNASTSVVDNHNHNKIPNLKLYLPAGAWLCFGHVERLFQMLSLMILGLNVLQFRNVALRWNLETPNPSLYFFPISGTSHSESWAASSACQDKDNKPPAQPAPHCH